jgi:hypothetical protein
MAFSKHPIIDNVRSGPLTPDVSLHYQTGAPPKGSDAEAEQYYWDITNGSKLITPADTVQGTLAFDSVNMDDSDLIDWYKFRLTDIDPNPGVANGARNITVELNSYTDGSGGYTLYEYALTPINETVSTLSEDYADIIDVTFLYIDPWNGWTNLGGWTFFYDDMDDSDGWSWRSNWTVDYVAPVPSTGPEDMDGRANGISEEGWYYIGIALNWYEKSPGRGSFDIGYDITVDSSRRQMTDPGSNTFDAPGEITSDLVYRVYSRYNNVDWYKVSGSDPEKLWNMSINVTRTGLALPRPMGSLYPEPLLHAWMIWHHPGDDMIWGTDDDGLTGYHFIFSVYWNGYDEASGIFFIGTGDESGQWVKVTRRVDWIVPDMRDVYLGFYSEPIVWYDDGSGRPIDYFQAFFALSEYRVSIDIIEESLNRAPGLSPLRYASDWTADPDGGNFDSVYTFDVKYTDPDNDPPATLYMQIDPDTLKQVEYDLLGKEVNKADTNYADGKDYRITLTGAQIGEGVHDISVETSDHIPVGSLRTSISPPPTYKNDTLTVWDDYPVEADPDWEGVPSILEDDPSLDVVRLSEGSLHGPFMDPEGTITSVKVWDDGTQRWSDGSSGDVVGVQIVNENGFIARITPVPDRNGKDTFKLMATDAHSSAEATMQVVVDPVNDLPVVVSLSRDGKTYDVSRLDSGIYEADLEDEWLVLEDKELEFRIVAEDSDLSGSLEYEYMDEISDSWSKDPVVEVDGTVTVTPTNEDLRRTTLAFSVSDGTASVQLRMDIKVKNTNDAPAISFKVPPRTEYSQFERVSMRPSGEDADPGDTLSYSVNMETALSKDHPSILDQLGLDSIEDDQWSMDPRTGEFTFDLEDQGIWGIGPDRLKVRTVMVAFKATDLAKATALTSMELTLSDLNEAPEPPSEFFSEVYQEDVDPSTPYLLEYLRVHLSVDPVSDPDGDTIVYRWDMGDGNWMVGLDINYTYAAAGTRAVRVWASDGEYDSEIMTRDITTTTKSIPPPIPPEEDFPVLVVVLIVLAVLGVVAVVAFVFLRGKGKKDGRDGTSDPQNMRGYR